MMGRDAFIFMENWALARIKSITPKNQTAWLIS